VAFRYPLLISPTWKLLVIMGMSLLIFVVVETGAKEPFFSNGYIRYSTNIYILVVFHLNFYSVWR
jgi:hypothetical protein